MVLVLTTTAAAQHDASSISRSGIGEAVGMEVRVSDFNPAALAWIKGGGLVLSAVPAPYGLPELRRGGAMASERIVGLGAGISFTFHSAGSSRSVGGRASVGYSLSDDMAAGLDVRMSRWTFPRYEPRTEFGAGFGIAIVSGPAMTGGILRLTGQEGRPLALHDLSAGIGCRVEAGNDVDLLVECMQGSIVPITVRWGAIVRPIEHAALICSWSENPATIGAGIEWGTAVWNVQFGAQWHSVLGWTQALDVRISWE